MAQRAVHLMQVVRDRLRLREAGAPVRIPVRQQVPAGNEVEVVDATANVLHRVLFQQTADQQDLAVRGEKERISQGEEMKEGEDSRR